MDYNGFKSKVLDKAETIYKKKAYKCETCDGKVLYKDAKDGKPYADLQNVPHVTILVYLQEFGNEVAGLKRQHLIHVGLVTVVSQSTKQM